MIPNHWTIPIFSAYPFSKLKKIKNPYLTRPAQSTTNPSLIGPGQLLNSAHLPLLQSTSSPRCSQQENDYPQIRERQRGREKERSSQVNGTETKWGPLKAKGQTSLPITHRTPFHHIRTRVTPTATSDPSITSVGPTPNESGSQS